MRTSVFAALIPVLIFPTISFTQALPRDERDQQMLDQHFLLDETHKFQPEFPRNRLADRHDAGVARFSTKFHSRVNRAQTMLDSVHEAWIRHYGAGLAPAQDRATGLAIDGLGNTYVTGYSARSPFGIDYYTIKYSPSGAVLWSARYDGGGNDFAQAIAVDASGNVYVTGYSETTGASFDYATVKYNTTGVEQWVVRYNGPGNSGDYAWDIAVDGSGNVFVTGYSASLNAYPYNYDYATIKYDSSGVEQWVARYNGPGNDWDRAYRVAVDGSGNVYVAGHSAASGVSPYNFDYATIKYNNSGEQQWVSRYNGPANANDDPYDLAVDGSGNVFVTGYSEGLGSYFDYATVKYNNFGVQQWVVRYNGPGNSDDIARSISLDGSGNILVTGYSYGSGTSHDCTTIKYNTSGTEQWVARYNGPGNANDAGYAIGLDGSDNVYVTGQSAGSGTYYDYATIKYNSAGVEQWVARYDGPGNFDDIAVAIAVDNEGNVYVTGESYGSPSLASDYATIKYNTLGVQEWVARYNGPGNSDDGARAIAVGASGQVYVTGWSRGIGSDYATLKYSANGSLEWSVRYNGPGNSTDAPSAIAIDDVGNVYVAGYSVGAGTAIDYATVKYSAAGEQQWLARYNGPGNSEDYAYAIAVDASGNVYVTGDSRSAPTGNSYDYATVKYDASGNQLWVARYNGPGNYDDRARAVAVDNSGNVYVTGYGRVSGVTNDYITVKYNSAGQQQWVANYNGPGNGNDYAYALTLDDSGNVYVSGYSRGPGIDIQYDYATVKYNSAGQQQWVARYNGPGNLNDYAEAIAIDSSGNVYVTGWSWGNTSYDYATVKYNNSGVEQWIARYDGPGNNSDIAFAITADNSGNVYVTGTSAGTPLTWNYTTIKYDSSGAQQWLARYYGPGNSNGDAYAVAVDPSGNVYVAGRTYSSDYPPSWSIFTTLKYQQEFLPLPAQVQLVSPSHGTNVNADSVTLIWRHSLPEVTNYWLQVSADSTFTALVVNDSTLTDTSRQLNGLSYNARYWWRVNARNASGTSDWSVVWNLTTIVSLPAQVRLLSPEHGVTVNDSVTFLWQRSQPEVDRYWFALALDSNFTFVQIDSNITDTTIFRHLASARRYWWRVRAHNVMGWGQYSEPRTFTVVIVGVGEGEEIPTVFSLGQNYPNPFNPTTQIKYGLPKESFVTLKVYNMLGQEVVTLVNEVQAAGYVTTVWGGRNALGQAVGSGVYFYRLTAGQFVETRKMILTK